MWEFGENKNIRKKIEKAEKEDKAGQGEQGQGREIRISTVRRTKGRRPRK